MVENWDLKNKDFKIIQLIVHRAKKHYGRINAMKMEMDLTVCHLNGCPLDLVELLAADDLAFTGDICGISNNIDRNTGKLLNYFTPEFTK